MTAASPKDDLVERITQYLGAGGLFNPEAMEHNKLRDLLLDCRDRIEALERELAAEQRSRDADAICYDSMRAAAEKAEAALSLALAALEAADAMRGEGYEPRPSVTKVQAYDAARAKVKA